MTQGEGSLEESLNAKDGKKTPTLIHILLLKLQYGKKYVMLLESLNGRMMKITRHPLLVYQN
jgi:hypothetical protein